MYLYHRRNKGRNDRQKAELQRKKRKTVSQTTTKEFILKSGTEIIFRFESRTAVRNIKELLSIECGAFVSTGSVKI